MLQNDLAGSLPSREDRRPRGAPRRQEGNNLDGSIPVYIFFLSKLNASLLLKHAFSSTIPTEIELSGNFATVRLSG
jgi:hypothetical protein